MKQRLFAPLLFVVLGLTVLGSGCVGAPGTRGWAAPVPLGDLLLVSTGKGKLDAIDRQTGALRWRFPSSDEGTWAFPTKVSTSQGLPALPRLASALSASGTSVEVTSTKSLKKDDRALIGNELVAIADIKGRIVTLARREGAVAHSQGDVVLPLRDKPPAPLQGVYADPIVAAGVIFIGDFSGYVYALKERAPGLAGHVIWARKTGGSIVGSLAIDSATSTLFVTAGDGKLYALNTADGSDRFPPFGTEKRVWAGPVVAEGRVFVASADAMLYAVDARSGAPAWDGPFLADGALMASPVVANRTVVVGSFDKRLYAVDATNGRSKWSFEAGNWIWSRPIVSADTVYFADLDGRVFALSLDAGLPIWDQPFEVGEPVRAALALAGDVLLVASTAGDLFGLNRATGVRVWGPVSLGVSVHADLVTLENQVIVAPSKCVDQVEPDQSRRRKNYFSVDGATGNVQPSLGEKGC